MFLKASALIAVSNVDDFLVSTKSKATIDQLKTGGVKN